MAKYNNTSMYRNTPMNAKYLGNYVPPITLTNDTKTITVESKYKHRPDLLAFDLYGDASVWWIFTLFNRDNIVNPMYDLEPEMKLIVPITLSSIGL
jgi:hypothetical protein